MKPTIDLVTIENAGITLGNRWVWNHLNLKVKPGEFIAVLGPNGSGKTSLLKTILGLVPLSAGKLAINGQPPARSRHQIGYIPQQKSFDPDLPLRGRDLVQFGLDGFKYGLSASSSDLVNQALSEVGAVEFADKPIGQLSGGQQQRLRIAQALLGTPKLLLCDEPLLSLDLSQQQIVSTLIDQRRKKDQFAVLFVTHDINPILPIVDRVLYFAHGRWAIGTPDEVLTNDTLSQLFKTPIEVLHVKGRIMVLGADEAAPMDPEAHHPHHPNHHHHV